MNSVKAILKQNNCKYIKTIVNGRSKKVIFLLACYSVDIFDIYSSLPFFSLTMDNRDNPYEAPQTKMGFLI